MKNSDIFYNTEIILRELTISAVDYLKLLKPQDRSSFASKWSQISDKSNDLALEELLYQINELIFEFPALRQEFLGNINLTDIIQVKFDPNAVPEKAAPQNDDNSGVRITNEVVNASKKIQIANEQLRGS